MRKKYFNERNNTDEQYEDASYNASDTKKQSDVSAKVFTAKGRVDIHNQHVVIPMITNAKKKISWKTIYESIDENYLKESKNSLMSLIKYVRLRPINNIPF